MLRLRSHHVREGDVSNAAGGQFTKPNDPEPQTRLSLQLVPDKDGTVGIGIY